MRPGLMVTPCVSPKTRFRDISAQLTKKIRYHFREWSPFGQPFGHPKIAAEIVRKRLFSKVTQKRLENI